jgi:hypothetical protein
MKKLILSIAIKTKNGNLYPGKCVIRLDFIIIISNIQKSVGMLTRRKRKKTSMQYDKLMKCHDYYEVHLKEKQ